MAWRDHTLPFRSSAAAWSTPDFGVEKPTASQTVVEEQETPLNRVVIAPDADGVARVVQLVPFQSSAPGCSGTGPTSPTPKQVVRFGQLIDPNAPPLGAGGLAAIAQALPFHVSARLKVLLVLLLNPLPTARQPAVVQLTPERLS